MKYSDIENMTNAEAVAYYAPLTNFYIPCRDLENLLDWSGVAKRNAITAAWQGSLIDFMSNPPAGAESLAEGLEELFSHLNKPHSIGADTHEQPWASKMDDLLNGLQLVGLVDAQFAADVVALGGGFAYPNVDEAYFQAIRDEEALRVANEAQAAADSVARKANLETYGERYNQHLSAVLSNPQSTEAQIKTAIEALAASYGA